MEKTLEPIFFLFKQRRKGGEALGDFCARVGFPALREYAEGYVPQGQENNMPAVHVSQAVYTSLQSIAEKQVRISFFLFLDCNFA